MSKKFLYLIPLLLFLSCKSEEIASNANKQITKADHPYYQAFHQGVRYKLQGRVEEAIKEFNTCLSIKQDDASVYYALSQLHLMKDDYALSSDYIKKAAELDPDNTWYTQELAYMYYEMKDFPNAIENFKKLTRKEPENVEWLFGYSEALIQNNQTKEAIEALNMIETQIGVNPQLSSQKYQIYMSMNDEEAALAELDKCKAEFPKSPQVIGMYVQHYFNKNDIVKAIVMLEELVETDPENGRAHMALADIYRQQGKLTDALRELKLAIRSADVDIDSKMNILIAIHDSSPTVNDAMMDVLNEMTATYPTDAKAWSISGDFLLKKGDDEGALDAYRKALNFDKSKYTIWNQVMIMEYQAGKFELLYEDSKACLELFPTLPTVYLLNGVGANLSGKHREAVDALSVGVELVVNDNSLKAEMLGQLGEAYFGIDDKVNGSKAYKDAIKLDPNSNLIKNNFAFRLANVKSDLDLAESLIDQVLKERNDIAQYLDTKGWILFQKGDYTQALTYFKQAFDLDENDTMIMEHLGDVNAKQNDLETAKEWWQKAVDAGRDGSVLLKKLKDGKYYEPQ